MKYEHRFALREAAPSMRLYEADGVRMRLDFCENMLRVALLREDVPLVPTWSVWPLPGDCPLEGRDKLSTEGFALAAPKIEEDDETLHFTLSDVDFTVEKKNFRITARNEKGILYADRSGLAYNFAGELGDGSLHYTRREPGERIFGLGDKGGPVNKSGRSFSLSATDSMGFRAESSDPLYKQIPFYICENSAGSYGLYYDSYSNGRINFGQEHDNYFEPFNWKKRIWCSTSSWEARRRSCGAFPPSAASCPRCPTGPFATAAAPWRTPTPPTPTGSCGALWKSAGRTASVPAASISPAAIPRLESAAASSTGTGTRSPRRRGWRSFSGKTAWLCFPM